jgi:hypothetical protein
MNKAELDEMIKTITPEQAQTLVQALIGMVAKEEPTKKKKRRKNKYTKLQQEHTQVQQSDPDEEIVIDEPQPTLNKRPKPQRTSQPSKGKPARSEPLQTGKRKNRFLTMGEYNAHRNDVEIDKILHKNTPTIERRPPHHNVTVSCGVCNRQYSVAPQLVYRDDDGIHYTCKKCVKRSNP